MRLHPRQLARTFLALALLAAADPVPAVAELAERWQKMNQPVEPFRILGNLYYVGANSVTAFLITTPDGHVLIDGGFEETVEQITANVEKLGFEIEDVALLLNSHAHFDHAGGLALLKEASGAAFVASELEAPLLERGGLGDDLLGDIAPFTPIRADSMVKDGEVVVHGGMHFRAHVTAGHTRGCTSWAFEVEEAGEKHLAVSICSLSVLDGMRFHDDPTYPGIAGDFERSFARLESLPCDVFLAAHAGFFEMKEKRQRMGEEGPNPFLDREGYLRYIARARERFEKAVAEEAAGEPPMGTIEPVADGVFAFSPTDEARESWRAVSNSGAVVLDDGVLIYEFTAEWIATLEKVLELGATRFVPGHGALASADDVRDQIAYLRWLRQAVEPFARDGVGVEAAKAAIELPERYAGYLFDWHLAPGIEKVYDELTER